MSYRRDPAAEIRAIQRKRRPLEARLEELQRRGVVVPSVSAGRTKTPFVALGRRPGALKRFLDDRNE